MNVHDGCYNIPGNSWERLDQICRNKGAGKLKFSKAFIIPIDLA